MIIKKIKNKGPFSILIWAPQTPFAKYFFYTRSHCMITGCDGEWLKMKNEKKDGGNSTSLLPLPVDRLIPITNNMENKTKKETFSILLTLF